MYSSLYSEGNYLWYMYCARRLKSDYEGNQKNLIVLILFIKERCPEYFWNLHIYLHLAKRLIHIIWIVKGSVLGY